MTTDAHGNPTTGSVSAIERFDATLDRLLRYDAAVLDLWRALAADEPDFPMGQAMTAYLMLSATDAPTLPAAREAADKLRRLPLNARETGHAGAIDAWVDGRLARRGAPARRPARAVAGRPARPPGRPPARLLPRRRRRTSATAWAARSAASTRASALRASSWACTPSGSRSPATTGRPRTAGLAAVERNPDDVWAIHAVVHTYEMQGRVDEGIRFLRRREGDWGDGNLFTVHNWWHLALYLLEAGQPDGALAIYDEHLHNAGSAGVPLEMLDASALLWRLQLDGVGHAATASQLWPTPGPRGSTTSPGTRSTTSTR